MPPAVFIEEYAGAKDFSPVHNVGVIRISPEIIGENYEKDFLCNK